MRFCKGERCYWYSHEKRDRYGNVVRRKCYYEPGCILGWIDEFIELFKLGVEYRLRRKG
jgi:hypothetical protein